MSDEELWNNCSHQTQVGILYYKFYFFFPFLVVINYTPFRCNFINRKGFPIYVLTLFREKQTIKQGYRVQIYISHSLSFYASTWFQWRKWSKNKQFLTPFGSSQALQIHRYSKTIYKTKRKCNIITFLQPSKIYVLIQIYYVLLIANTP